MCLMILQSCCCLKIFTLLRSYTLVTNEKKEKKNRKRKTTIKCKHMYSDRPSLSKPDGQK